MKIQVQEVTTTKDQRTIVRFACSAGAGLAVWRGASSPIVGREYYIEFTVNEEIVLGQIAVPAERHDYLMTSCDDRMILTGMIDGMDEDGLAYFLLAPDRFMMIQSIGDGVSTGAWLSLVFPVTSVEMYDFEP